MRSTRSGAPCRKSGSSSHYFLGSQAVGNVSLVVRAVAVVTAAVIIAGCATSKGGSSTSTDWLSGACNPLIAGGIGAVIGAIAGGRNNQNADAAISTEIDALAYIAYDYYAKQTKNAQQ